MQNIYNNENEIDFRMLLSIIWDNKIFILSFTSIMSILSIIYVSFKNPIPIYKGKLLIELGIIKTENGLKQIESPLNLKYILKSKSNIKVLIPRRSNNLLEIIVTDINHDQIKEKINLIYNQLIRRQSEILKFYNEYIPTKKVGKITISNRAINKPRKKLIVGISFITSFILSISFVFFFLFIKSFKVRKKNE